MGTYNILRAKIECPRYSRIAGQEIDLHFGYTNEMLEFNLGDKYFWCSGRELQNGGRPENGNINGEDMLSVNFAKETFL